MIRFGFSLDDLIDTQSVIEDIYDKNKEINYKQDRIIREVFADLSNKIELIELSKDVLESRTSNYSTDGIDRIKEVVTFKEELNFQGIYLEKLKELKQILNSLLEENEVKDVDLEQAYAIIDQLIDFKFRS